MSSVKLPKGRSLADEYAQTLSAQSAILPNLLSTQAQYQPVQSSTQLANINALLNGTQASTYDTQEFTPAVYKKGNKYSYGAIPPGVQGTIQYPSLPDPKGGGKGGGGSGIPGLSGLPGMSGGGGMPSLPGMGGGFPSLPGMGGGFPSLPGMGGGFPSIPGLPGGGGGNPLSSIPGLGGLFGGGGGPKKKLISASGYKTTTHPLAAQRGLLDIYTQDVMPQLSGGIIPKLTDQANYDLDLGSNLDAGQMRNITQSLRSRQSGMLGGTGSAGDFNEALGLSAYGDQVRQLRRQFASNVSNMRMGGNPVGQALGLNSVPGATSLLNPESSYASDLYNTNKNMQVGGAISNANNQNALIGAGISSVGSLGGAAMGLI